MTADVHRADAEPSRGPFEPLTRCLAVPLAYRAFQRAIGGGFREKYVRSFIRPERGNRILDLGCGPGDILRYLRDVEYVGIDISNEYVLAATKRFKGRGKFVCKPIQNSAIEEPQSFDIVMANGVLHHLNNDEALSLLRLACLALKPEGRFVSLDGCWVDGQSAIARGLLRMDRGKHVRDADGYRALASQVFGDVRTEIRHDMLRVPYTHIILQCQGAAS